MTGTEARDAVIEAVKDHHRQNAGKGVQRIRIPWGVAYDLAKLGHCQIGELSEHILRDGPTPKHLSKMFGCDVEIDTAHETGSIRVEPKS